MFVFLYFQAVEVGVRTSLQEEDPLLYKSNHLKVASSSSPPLSSSLSTQKAATSKRATEVEQGTEGELEERKLRHSFQQDDNRGDSILRERNNSSKNEHSKSYNGVAELNLGKNSSSSSSSSLLDHINIFEKEDQEKDRDEEYGNLELEDDFIEPLSSMVKINATEVKQKLIKYLREQSEIE